MLRPINDDDGFVELTHICFLEADEIALDELHRGCDETSERGVVEHRIRKTRRAGHLFEFTNLQSGTREDVDV
ncbi:hypothetical protein DEJ32_01180 [Curtobacterium sp. MCPF17_046]|nr:hypothetical protein DEJ32_01180 [Curtobacterium sp. MCPF17_046]